MSIKQRQAHIQVARHIAKTLGVRRAAGYLRNMGWSLEGAVVILLARKLEV